MVGRSLTARVLAAALLAAPLIAHAAGLGKLTVLSALGRPLNAEIEVISLQPGELDTLSARLASHEAFRQAGVEFNPALISLRFAIERRGANAFVKLTSAQPINEPFLDLLVELQWAAGRLVREYTFLLDPPGYGGPQVIAAAPTPAAEKPAVAPPPAAVAPPSAFKPEPAMAAAPTQEAPAPAAEAAPAEQPALPMPVKPEVRIEEKPLAEESQPPPAEQRTPAIPELQRPRVPERPSTYRVQRGDTLSEIAVANFQGNVTLNQMLIALYRKNQDAFIRENINLVRAGRILAIPTREEVASVGREEARRLVLSHMADFSEYRRSLAAAAERSRPDTATADRTAAGRIEIKTGETAPSAPRDEVKLSKVDPKQPSAAMARAAREDDIAARERALQEAQSRVADLEKNLADLRKLLEMRNQQLAALEKMASEKAAEAPKPAPAPVPSAAAKVAEAKPAAAAPKPAAPEPVKPAAASPQPAAAEPAKPAVATPPLAAATPAKPAAPEAPKPAAAAPSPAVAAPPPPKPAPETAAPKPAPAAPKPAVSAPTPKPPATIDPTPSLVDEFLNNPTAIGGLGLVVAILLGYGAWAWRRQKASRTQFRDSVLGSASASVAASSVFGPSQKTGTGPSSVVLPSVSQSSVSGMETDEVDPIAEADVYMAYGRDGQAEEILKEALAKDSRRTAIHEKLLEIYANRRDPKAFEQTALKLKEVTGGVGSEWDKAVALGRSIDPDNTLYGGAGRAVAAAAAAAAAGAAAGPVLDFDLNAGAPRADAPDLVLGTPGPEPSVSSAVDIDLGMGGAPEPVASESTFTADAALGLDSPQSGSGGLDFDLGASEAQKGAPGGLDFELPSADVPGAPPAGAAPPEKAGALDFDLQFDLGETKSEPGGGLTEPSAAQGPLDLSSISLDLGGPGEGGGPSSTDPKWQEVATKLDLAKAYEEMGDKSGASELLNEVLREGDNAQRNQAQQMLAKLA